MTDERKKLLQARFRWLVKDGVDELNREDTYDLSMILKEALFGTLPATEWESKWEYEFEGVKNAAVWEG